MSAEESHGAPDIAEEETAVDGRKQDKEQGEGSINDGEGSMHDDEASIHDEDGNF